MTEAVVQTRDLTKRYGPFTALHELNMQIEKGAIHGFIGPNGAGKTTTMRILATLLKPTYGEAWVSGYPVMQAPHDVRRRIGYMPDFFGVYDNMKVWEYLDFFAASYNVPQSRRKGMTDDLLALVDLTAKHDSFVDDLSRGMKQRLCLARTLVHEPDLLILDEPASGLDPHARIELRELLKELRRLGKTILISSHILTELAEMCTHIAIIERGNLLLSGSVAEILQAMQPARDIYVRVLDRANDATRLLETLPGILSVKILPPGYMPNQRLHQSGAAQPDSPQVPQQPVSGNGGTVSHIPPPPGAIPPPPTDALSPGEAMYGPVRVATSGPATVHMRMNGDDALLSTILSHLVRHEIPVFGFEEAMSNLEDIFLRTTKGLVQ
jgi:ABC-2 type transport system ATP-binding protein